MYVYNNMTSRKCIIVNIRAAWSLSNKGKFMEVYIRVESHGVSVFKNELRADGG